MKIPHIQPLDRDGYRKFGLIMAVIIAVLFGLFLPWVFNAESYPLIPWYIAAVFTVWALVLPGTLGVIYKPWMIFGLGIGFINTRIILGAVFYLMFTPIAILLKLLGKDLLKRKTHTSDTSYWINSHKQPKEHMENIY